MPYYYYLKWCALLIFSFRYNEYIYLFLWFSLTDPGSRNESNTAATPGATEGVMLVRAKQLVAILAISLPLATLMLGLFVYCVWRKLRMTSKGEKELLITLFKQSKCISLIIALNIYMCCNCSLFRWGFGTVRFGHDHKVWKFGAAGRK